jgi:hypothetical protein
MPSWQSARPTWVGCDEVMPAPIGVQRAEQAVPADRLGQAEEARHGAFLVDQERRIDRSRRVVEGDDEIEIAPQRRDPAMGGTVLEQQHSRQRPAHAGSAPALSALVHVVLSRSSTMTTIAFLLVLIVTALAGDGTVS